MSFHVLPVNLHRSGDAFEDLGDLMRDVLAHSESYVEVNADHAQVGTFFLDVKDRTNQLQDQLRRNYSVNGPVTGYYFGAGEALHEVARDYESVDQQQAAGWDAMLACTPGDQEYDFTLPPYSGLDITEIRAMLTPPTGWTEFEQGWQQVQNGIDYLCSLDFITDMLVWPVAEPMRTTLQEARDAVNGPWMEVGRAAAALHTLGSVNHEMNIRVALAAQDLSWHGNAADIAKSNIDRFREVMDEHVGNLHSVAEFLNMRSYAMVKITDIAVSLIEYVIDFCTSLNPLDILDALSKGRVPPILTKVLTVIPLITLCVDLLGAVLAGLGLTFHALLDRDVAVPDINPPSTATGGP
jgi:hypothetical protein